MVRGIGRGLVMLVAAVLSAAPGESRANGQAEYVAPLDRPVPAAPGRALPYPVAEEAGPRGVPSTFLAPLPADFAYLSTPALSRAQQHDNALGHRRHCYESLIVRGSELSPGKVVIPAGGLAYVSENSAGALPFRQDVLCVAGTPLTLVDFEQTIVTRKNVTIGPSEPVLLGSELFRLRSISELGDMRSAVVEVTALTGFDWGRLGSGSLELSISQPGWHARTFHYGLHQGRVEQLSAKDVRLAWLSGLRTDAVVLAEKRELSGKLEQGAERALTRGGVVRLARLDPAARRVELDTPDGKKTLSAAGDLRGLPADSAARKRLIAVGANYAFVLVPEASDFGARQAHVEVYSGLRQYRHGESVPEARGYRAFAHAHYTGAVHGLSWVNEQPLELTPSQPSVEGPQRTFKLTTRWTADGALESFEIEDREGKRSSPVPAAGRTSINLLAGAGPTIESILTRVGTAPLAGLAARSEASRAAAPGPAPSASAAKGGVSAGVALPATSPELIRPALFWICAAAVLGLLIGFGLGRAR